MIDGDAYIPCVGCLRIDHLRVDHREADMFWTRHEFHECSWFGFREQPLSEYKNIEAEGETP